MLNDRDIKVLIKEYIKEYDELITKSEYFTKGVFNHNNVSVIGKNLNDNGFFKVKNKILIKDKEIKSKKELDDLVKEEKEKIFSLVKGKKTPLSFQFVMMLKPDLSPEFLAKYNLAVREDEIAGLFINILYDRQGLKCTSGVSRKTFVLDKTLEEAWDQEVKERFLTKYL